jgi:hypothetical protein
MQRRALIVGINTYKHARNLKKCVADAEDIAKLLWRNHDGKLNYDCKTLLDVMEDGSPITRSALREACIANFSDFKDEVLFYFSGHGALTPFGGHLCAYDSEKNDYGIPMLEIVQMCLDSRARDILLILDCCHSGDIASPSFFKAGQNDPLSLLREDMTIIASSRESEASFEGSKHGMFTQAVLDGLDGGAADHMGWVTGPSIYAYVERRFGQHMQRPIYKSHATRVAVVRECAPLIERLKLHRLVDLFPTFDYKYRLDPEYDPEDKDGNIQGPVDNKKIEIAQLFKEYRDAGLLKPSIPGEQLYWAARRSHTVELTTRGCEYWILVKDNRI